MAILGNLWGPSISERVLLYYTYKGEANKTARIQAPTLMVSVVASSETILF